MLLRLLWPKNVSFLCVTVLFHHRGKENKNLLPSISYTLFERSHGCICTKLNLVLMQYFLRGSLHCFYKIPTCLLKLQISRKHMAKEEGLPLKRVIDHWEQLLSQKQLLLYTQWNCSLSRAAPHPIAAIIGQSPPSLPVSSCSATSVVAVHQSVFPNQVFNPFAESTWWQLQSSTISHNK